MSGTATLGIGVIGCGTIAFSAHLPAIRRLRDRLRLVATADVRAELAARAAREFGAEAHYADYRQLLARPDIAIVVICTPEFLHAEQVGAAAAAGKHILCEKPMADTLDAADAMLDAAARAGVKLMVGHSRRFTPRYRAVRAAIDRGAVGAPRLIRENERRPRAMYGALDLPVGPWAPGGKPWTGAAAYTRGAALTNAVHETDLLRWFAGAEAESVYAESRITDPDGEVPDFITLTVRFRNGAIGATEVVNRLPPGYPYYHHLEVFGEAGLIRAADPGMVTLTDYRAGAGLDQPLNFGALLHIEEAYVAELRALVDAVRDDTPVPLPPTEARAALALALAAVRSSEEGREVGVEGRTSEDRRSGSWATASAPAAPAVPPPTLNLRPSTQPSAPLRCGLFGSGPRAGVLAAAVTEHPGAVLAATVQDAGGGTWYGYATPAELLAAPDIDLVLIAGEEPGAVAGDGADGGAGWAGAALARGKAVLCLTPPADLAQFDALAALAARHGAPLGLPNELRFLPATRALRDTVARGETGPLLSAFAAWRTRRAPGDLLRDLGAPLLDLLRWCLPAAGAIVRAQATVAPPFGHDRSAALLTLRTASGLVCTVELAAALPPDHEQEDEVLIEILGEEAALRAEPYNQAIAISGPGERRRLPWHRDALYPLLDAFVAALREGREPPGAPAEVRPTFALIEELRGAESVERGA